MHEADTAAVADPVLTITQVEKRDTLAHVIMLAHRIWPDAYKDILTPEQIRNMLDKIYNYENLEAEMKAGHQFYVGYLDIMPVAYSSAYLEDDIIWLKKLYVDAAQTGKRIGVRMMHAAVASLLPASEIRVLANAKNTPAHQFYEHMGFSKIDEVPVKMGDWDFCDCLFSMPLTDN